MFYDRSVDYFKCSHSSPPSNWTIQVSPLLPRWSLRNLVSLLPPGSPAPRLHYEWLNCLLKTSSPSTYARLLALEGSSGSEGYYTVTTSSSSGSSNYPDSDASVASSCSSFHHDRRRHQQLTSHRHLKCDNLMSPTTPGSNQEQKSHHLDHQRHRVKRQYRNKQRHLYNTTPSSTSNGSTTSSSPSTTHQPPHRIAKLEVELAELRSQIASLLLAQQQQQGQGHPMPPPPITSSPRTEADGQSVVLDERSLVTTPIPPPPPPPPPVRSTNTPKRDWRAELVAKKRAKAGLMPTDSPLPQSPGGDMSQVLKELKSGSIRLKSVPRSPGGTPIKQKPAVDSTILPMDPCSIIARALQERSRLMRASAVESSASLEESKVGNRLVEIPMPDEFDSVVCN